ncbi:MAG: GLPGLI family protein [Chitinophagaceae bacterium]|jgi:GLPGLI family protein|nr:GLPGLI family protein [Chitinophagaceae bacterium]
MKTILSIVFFSLFIATQAQQVFVSAGKIEFEKQVNLHKELDAENDGQEDIWTQNLKKNLPKSQLTYYNLFFNESQSIYKSGREVEQGIQKIPEWMSDRSTENITYKDFSQNKTTILKSVFESTFLIEDSIRHIDWRITSDTRTIAGIECRKAIGKIMDSIYVIAFYTDLITLSSGPESFAGLPGMILGVAIPRINTTWFATKIELITITDAMLLPPKKGKKSSFNDLQQQLEKSIKDWGKYGRRMIWKFMI